MTDIHKILTEWTYRLDSGYPKTDSDYEEEEEDEEEEPEEEPEDEYALSIMSELLNKGADPNIQNKCGETALMNALQLKSEYAKKVVSLLVSQGATPMPDFESCLEMLQSPGPQVESVLPSGS